MSRILPITLITIILWKAERQRRRPDLRSKEVFLVEKENDGSISKPNIVTDRPERYETFRHSVLQRGSFNWRQNQSLSELKNCAINQATLTIHKPIDLVHRYKQPNKQDNEMKQADNIEDCCLASILRFPGYGQYLKGPWRWWWWW